MTYDEVMQDPTMSKKDRTEWLYNRRTELEGRLYYGEELAPEEELDIELTNQRLADLGAIPYHEMMAKVHARLIELWGRR